MTENEICYVCTLPMLQGQPFYVLKDDDGLMFAGHKECVEKEMELVEAPPAAAGA